MTNDKQDNEKIDSSLKEVTLFPIITALLKPAADFIGQELKEFTQEKIDTYKKKKQEENVFTHIQIVEEHIKQSGKEIPSNATIKKVEYFQEWIEGAQGIDPNDDEDNVLSKMWQELLHDILINKSGDKKVLIDTLKSLTTDEAKLLDKCSKRSQSTQYKFDKQEMYNLKKLKNKNLLELHAGILPLLLLTVIVTYLILIGLFTYNVHLPTPLYFIVPFTVGGITTIIFLKNIHNYKAIKLTWISEELVKYSKNQKKK